MSEQEFVAKWRGKESGVWVECACALFWARAYGMDPSTLTAMSNDYLSVKIENRASCSEQLAMRSVREAIKALLAESDVVGGRSRLGLLDEAVDLLQRTLQPCARVPLIQQLAVLRDLKIDIENFLAKEQHDRLVAKN